jgi:hypothetical protein
MSSSDVPLVLLARVPPSRDGWMGWLCPQTDDGMLREIAEADYGYRAAEHLAALRRIRDGREVPRSLQELPLEVLELVRYSEPDVPMWKPGGQGLRGHLMRLFCCAVLLTAAGEPALDGYIEDESTLRRLVASAVVLGTWAIDALLPLLCWRASLPPTDEADRAFLAMSLVLLAAARYREDGEGALLRELGEWAIECEARARAAVRVPLLTTGAWLLGLKSTTDGDDQWRALAWEILVEPRVPHPAEAAGVLGEVGARIVAGEKSN